MGVGGKPEQHSGDGGGGGMEPGKGKEEALAVTHIRLVPEARDAEGFQQVTTTEQEDAQF